MITERTFTVTISVVQHEGTQIPNPLDVDMQIAEMMQAKYPGRSINVRSTFKDASYGKEAK